MQQDHTEIGPSLPIHVAGDLDLVCRDDAHIIRSMKCSFLPSRENGVEPRACHDSWSRRCASPGPAVWAEAQSTKPMRLTDSCRS
jgi:hypothetical protein